MTTKTLYISILGGCLTLAACRAEEPLVPRTSSLSLGTTQLFAEDGSATSAPLPEDICFGTYTRMENTVDYQTSNVPWSYDKTSSSWRQTAYPNGIGISTITDIYAYAPYDAQIEIQENKIPIMVYVDQATNASGYQASDWLWAHGTTSAASTAIDLSFQHRMCKLVVNLYAGKGYENGLPDGDNHPQYSNCHVSFNGFSIAGQMDITTGEVSDLENHVSGDYKLYPRLKYKSDSTQGTGLAGDPKSYEYLIPPQLTTPGSVTITLSIDGALHTNKLSLTEMTFEPGKIYTLNYTVQEAGFDLQSMNITPWIDTPVEKGEFVRYSYSIDVDLATVSASPVSLTACTEYMISSPTASIIGDSNRKIGAIRHEYLFDSSTLQRKVAAEAIVAYALTPDKKGVDTLNGIVLKVLKRYDPAVEDPSSETGVVPDEADAVNGGEIDNLIYAQGTLAPVSKFYLYHNTVFTSTAGFIYAPYPASVDDPLQVPIQKPVTTTTHKR